PNARARRRRPAMTSLAAIPLVAMPPLGALIPEQFRLASGVRRRGLAMVAPPAVVPLAVVPLAVVPLAIVCPGAAPGQFRFATLAAAYWRGEASMQPRMGGPRFVSMQA